MKTAERVVNELVNEGFTIFEIACIINLMEKEVRGDNSNEYSLKSISARFHTVESITNG